MTYGRQQLLWQKQVTVIGSINLDSHIEEYHTGVAQFQHVVDATRFVNREYCSCDFGRTTAFTTTLRLQYDDVSE